MSHFTKRWCYYIYWEKKNPQEETKKTKKTKRKSKAKKGQRSLLISKEDVTKFLG